MFHAPCRKCKLRYLDCHSKCKKYAEYAEKVKKIREKRLEENIQNSDVIEVLKRR